MASARLVNVQAIADRQIFPVSALSENSETLVEDELRKVLSFFPESLELLRRHPDGKAWTSEGGSYLLIIRLRAAANYLADSEW